MWWYVILVHVVNCTTKIYVVYTFHVIHDKLLNHDLRFSLCTILSHNNAIAQFFCRHKILKVVAMCIIFHLKRESTLLCHCIAIQSMSCYTITIINPLKLNFYQNFGKWQNVILGCLKIEQRHSIVYFLLVHYIESGS